MGSDVVSISDAAAIAIHAAAALAKQSGGVVSAKAMADSLHVSQAHLAKVMQRLVKAGLVDSVRGPQGGFTLSKAPADVTLLEVYEAIEGPFTPRECLFRHKVCKRGCGMKDLVDDINEKVLGKLTGTTLRDLVCDE